ncbi:MAG: hypothetical protein OXI88_05230 [Gammaproteobacteria bacterium]|nr:hypothetical protein [Gammaproteobacteria bacterium]MDE0511168.1 hypothetical protein [Gammaproteobacteria bacterium]
MSWYTSIKLKKWSGTDAHSCFAELHPNVRLTGDRLRLPANTKMDMARMRASVMTSVGGRMKSLE